MTESTFTPNYDESQVPPYVLPDALTFDDGSAVRTISDWQQRRAELLDIFSEHIYGYAPRESVKVSGELIEEGPFRNNAFRRQVRLWFNDDQHSVDLLIVYPNKTSRKVPAFLGYNFKGNHTVDFDEAIFINEYTSHETRGFQLSRWPLDFILSRGYAVVTACYHDVDPDKNDFTNGIHPLFYDAGQTKPAHNEWGAIGAWSWGLSRILDYLEDDSMIDATRVAVHGHSRLGKTALWAAAQDERFALAISNDSGCMGAAISRRRFGETVWRINTGFPHWFCDNFKKYNNAEDQLPVDQHQLIALIAPRPVYVASAADDLWADPKGEFLSAAEAQPVYKLCGKTGLQTQTMPPIGISIGETIGYHIREGKHDVKLEDWQHFVNFADRFLRDCSKSTL